MKALGCLGELRARAQGHEAGCTLQLRAFGEERSGRGAAGLGGQAAERVLRKAELDAHLSGKLLEGASVERREVHRLVLHSLQLLDQCNAALVQRSLRIKPLGSHGLRCPPLHLLARHAHQVRHEHLHCRGVVAGRDCCLHPLDEFAVGGAGRVTALQHLHDALRLLLLEPLVQRVLHGAEVFPQLGLVNGHKPQRIRGHALAVCELQHLADNAAFVGNLRLLRRWGPPWRRGPPLRVAAPRDLGVERAFAQLFGLVNSLRNLLLPRLLPLAQHLCLALQVRPRVLRLRAVEPPPLLHPLRVVVKPLLHLALQILLPGLLSRKSALPPA
mmetsp:Transcript_101115/g.294404  ORF Transcript_101115/g.294404 Transcript_101115/m.294404 type:complete len:329 (-) Transcript_101115:833-1819(-)